MNTSSYLGINNIQFRNNDFFAHLFILLISIVGDFLVFLSCFLMAMQLKVERDGLFLFIE